jgi:hypothetical protein
MTVILNTYITIFMHPNNIIEVNQIKKRRSIFSKLFKKIMALLWLRKEKNNNNITKTQYGTRNLYHIPNSTITKQILFFTSIYSQISSEI